MKGKERKQAVSSWQLFIQMFTLPLANVWGVLLFWCWCWVLCLVGGVFVCFGWLVRVFLGGKHYNIKNVNLRAAFLYWHLFSDYPVGPETCLQCDFALTHSTSCKAA